MNGSVPYSLLAMFSISGLCPRIAWAEPPTASGADRGAAESLFDAGRRAMARGNYDEACAKFEASNQLDSAVGTVLNLANCNEARGRRALALEQFREALARLSPADPRRSVAVERLTGLDSSVPKVTLKLSHTAPAGATVILDGTVLPPQSLDTLLPLDVGDHLVLVRAFGHQDRQYKLSLTDGQRLEFDLRAGVADPSGATASPEPTTPPRSVAKVDAAHGAIARPKKTHVPVVGYVVGGVGVLALGASLTTGILALSKEQSLDGACKDKPSGGGRYCTPEGLAAADTGQSLAIASDVLLGVGLAGVAAGAWLVFFHSETGSVGASATPLHGGATLDVRGTL